MKSLLLVFFGGGLGSVARFSISNWINTLHRQTFPWGTLSVNIIACFTVGLIIGLAEHKRIISPDTRLFWTVGFCGGFSTFSTFSHDVVGLLQHNLTPATILYITASVALCVAATYAALFFTQSM